MAYSLYPVDAGGDDQSEGTGTPTVYRFLVTRSVLDVDSLPDETLDWSVAGSGTNPADGFDFSLDGVFPSGSIHFALGAAQADTYIEFNTLADSVFEFDEGFTLTLLNGALVLASATGIIRNDDLNVIEGTAGADDLVGTGLADLLVGIGDDRLEGLGGDDTYAIRDGRLAGKSLVEAADGGAADVLSIEAALAGNIIAAGATLPDNIEQLRIASSLSGLVFADQDGIANDWTFEYGPDAVTFAVLGGLDTGAGDDRLTFDVTLPPNPILPPSPILPPNPIRLSMGSGDDALTVRLADSFVPTPPPIRTLGLIDLGDGNDSLDLEVITSAIPNDPVRILAGAGDDSVVVDITANFLLPSPPPIRLLDTLELGVGNDSLNLSIVSNAFPNDPMRVLGESGDDTISLTFNGGSWIVDGGIGNDLISLNLVTESVAEAAFTVESTQPGAEGHGGAGLDLLLGSSGDDRMFGEADSDFANGAGGDDFIDLGAGKDAATGGAGADVFALSLGLDQILDFEDGRDQIALPTGTDFEDLTIRNGPGGVTVSFGDYAMKLVGHKAKAIDTSDFVIVPGSFGTLASDLTGPDLT